MTDAYWAEREGARWDIYGKQRGWMAQADTEDDARLIVAALTAKQSQQPATLAEPLFLLHTGAVYGDERDDWEIEANSGDAVDAYCDANPGKTVGLYLTTPAQQPAALAERKGE